MQEKIDILMATYNGEKYLKQQIDSILNQTYKNIELYISDDCSNDNTVNILKEYEKKDKRINLFLNDKNIGAKKNFEQLLKKVKSNYFMFADQDDVWLDNKIEITFNKLINTGSDLVFTDLCVVDENLKVINTSFNDVKGYNKKIKRCVGSNDLVFLYNTVTGCSILAKSKWIKKYLDVKCDKKNILHDHILPLIISLYGKISYVNTATILYRQHGSNEVGAKRYTDSLKTFDEVRKHLIEVKLNLLNFYYANISFFPQEKKELIKAGIEYFDKLNNKKHIKFRYLRVFTKLYNKEKLSYKILYFTIFNVPIIARFGYFIKNIFKRKKGE